MRLLATFVLPALLAACDGGDLGLACTDEAVSSVTVTITEVFDTVPDDVQVTYSVDGGSRQDCVASGDDVWACGWEEAGEIEVRADAAGYQPAIATVTVGADECHVITEAVELELEPAG